MEPQFIENLFLLLAYISLFMFVCGVLGAGQWLINAACCRWSPRQLDSRLIDDAVPGIHDLEEEIDQ